ncbi:thermonuclease family protein [Laspinema olomoucense]|uniref:thermonuclease family protein n=1 Tax=Laspinema olomoucense TaxID=3231600 RepID=UPI0021BB9AA5|nr:thermonuclease family protein [Laspinema sp. D3d]MCT7975222.1 thermonuclease family protein [Laspinema sp. D3d]
MNKKLQQIINWAAPIIGVVAVVYGAYTRIGVSAGPGSVVSVRREEPEAMGIYTEPMESGQSEFSEIWEVTTVYDGDTLTLQKDGEERKVRFCGVDAPEKNQPGGKESAEFLRAAVERGGGKVGVTFVEKDRYGRWVAEVWSDPGQFEEELLNSALIVSGHAWVYKQFWGNCPNRAALEASEKSAEQYGTAPWKQSGNIAPWKWRKRK